MNLRRCPWPVLAVAIWLTASGKGAGQDADGYKRRANDVEPHIENPNEALRARLRIGHDLNDSSRIIANLMKLSGSKEVEDFARILRDDPERRQKLIDALTMDKQLRDQLESIRRDIQPQQLEEIRKAINTPPTEKKPPESGPVTNPMVNPEPSRENVPLPTTPDAKPSAAGAAVGENKTEPSAGLKDFVNKALPKAADVLADMGMKDDAEFLRSILRGRLPSDNHGYLARAFTRARDVAKELPIDKVLSGDLSGVLDGLHLPSVPKFDFSSFGWGGSSSGSTRASGGTSTDTGGTALVWLLMLLILVLFLWKGKELYRTATAGAGGAWKLGPWPVQPDRVRTRADLVKAFEYLAFLVVGLAARPRNHLELASDLTGAEPTRRAAAERLANLYERARYAPQDEALAENDLNAARQDLTFLARVGPA